uniref:trihelix transcription factor ASIL1-like isoform X2 n=1 Tax=Erigeron canadensis TaxID=72917 RepID=UPI001CB949D2|nr:trihelix transcription factor ASIL1-like isoform X2 [Erigeron canadensis]
MRQKGIRGQPHSKQIVENYVDLDDDEVEDDEDEQEGNGGDNEMNGVVRLNGDGAEVDDEDTDDDGDDSSNRRSENINLHRHPKKRKLKSLLSSFELVPRVPTPVPLQVARPVVARSSFGGRNTLTDWSEHETFVLLDAWGERFLQRGRKSLRSEEWQEVANKVSRGSKMERTDTQCRNRLDTLKKKYKKEKALLEGNRGANSKWVYFKKMDVLMSSTPRQAGVSGRVDPGEYTLMNPTAFVNRSNGLDEMRESPGNTESQEGDDDDDDDLLPPKRSKHNGDIVNRGSFKLLADSINKFSDIYVKIETQKRKQMAELEKMRMDFHKELELQKQQILERARDEIIKLRRRDYEENDSAGNVSG